MNQGTKATVQVDDPVLHSGSHRSLDVSQVVPVSLALKRAIDLGGAVIGLVFVALPLLVLMVLVRLQDGGPALVVQERVGMKGRRFCMYKLRSMVPGAHALQPELLAHNEVDGPAFKLRKDPRVTPLGSWLRRTSLDELPQLVNVLLGHMSLVGPRPPLPEEAARYTARQRRRLDVPPGMTGLWQVSGRSALPFDQGIALDLYYVDHWTPWMDLWLLALTLPAVVRGTGAW